MTSGIVATLLADMLSGDIPWARTGRKFLGVLLEIESGRDQAIANRLVFGIIREIHLPIAEIASMTMKPIIRPGDHRQVVRIRGVKQCVKVGEAGSALRKVNKIGILHGSLIVGVLKHDNDDAVEVVRRSPGGRSLRLLFLTFGGFRDLRLGLNLRRGVDGASMENHRTEAPDQQRRSTKREPAFD